MTGEEAWKQIDDDNNDGNDTSDDEEDIVSFILNKTKSL